MGGKSTVLAVLLIFASLATVGECLRKKKEILKWECIKARYPRGNEEGHFTIPLNVGQITNNEYILHKTHELFKNISVYCLPDDPTVCPMYGPHGHIIGIRVSYVKSLIKTKSNADLPYSFKDKPIYQSGEMFNQEVYYVDAFFQDVEHGATPTTEPVGDGVYLNVDGKGWKKVPRTEEGMKQSPYTKHACFPGMGMHYWYKMTRELNCEEFQPPFFLFDQGQMVGFALGPFGHIDPLPGKRLWFEDPPGPIMRVIIPRGPKCVTDWVSKYGGISLHFWFIPEPQKLCPYGYLQGALESFLPEEPFIRQ